MIIPPEERTRPASSVPSSLIRHRRVGLLAASAAIIGSLAIPTLASADPNAPAPGPAAPAPAGGKQLSAKQAQKLEQTRRQKLAANDVKAQAALQPGEEVKLDKSNLQNLRVTNVTRTSDGAEFDMGSFVGKVRFVSADVVKVSIQAKGRPDYASPAIVKSTLGSVSLKRQKTNRKYTMKSGSVTVEVALRKFAVTMRDANGRVINADDSRFGSGYENGKPYVFKKTNKNEDFYGFGEQTKGLNKRGDSIGMWNTDHYAYEADAKYIYSSIPFFTGLKGNRAYGIFFDNTHHSYYEMASESDDYYYFYANGGELNYYFINGPKMGDVLDRYTQLTGTYEQPPEWSLGWEQSHWGYKPASKVVEVAKGYRDRKIPLDAMNLDIDYMNGWRLFTWDPAWGDPDVLDQQLEGMNVKTIAINDPGVKKEKGYWLSDEGTANGYFATNPDGSNYDGAVWAGTSNFPDFTRADVRTWWADQFSKLTDHGVEGIWLDMNEPAVFDGPNHTAPLDLEFDHSTKQHTEVHNIYGFWNTVATHKGMKKAQPGLRPFVFSRDMYAGSQRYAALWSGDNVSSWDHLKLTLPLNMNVGLSGVPHVGNDIGGFVYDTTPELFARWIQTGSFTPFARVHYDNTFQPDQQCQEPWCLGSEVEAIAKKYVSLRYSLLPYTNTAFHYSTTDGRPVEQALVYQFQNDKNVRDIDDQFMWGKDIMVAPVVTKGATSRKVYLPEGKDWIDWWSGKHYDGGQTITVAAPLDVMPIFVAQGAIIPTREVQQYTGQNEFTNVSMNVFLGSGSSATGSLYEDDGKTEKYKDGEWNMYQTTVSRNADGMFGINTQKTHSGYDSKLQTIDVVLRGIDLGGVFGNAKAAGSKVALDAQRTTNGVSVVKADASSKTVTVRIPAKAGKATLAFEGK
jgi:alpha-glucosidase